MSSPLYEAYAKFSFPRYDARVGMGYGSVSSNPKSKPSVGTPLQKQSLYPYVSPKESEYYEKDFSDSPELNLKTSKKLRAKIGGPVHINDPFSSNWVDRGAFVNWATRIDLYEGSRFSLQDIDFNIDPPYSLGGPSQIISMGNGAGIYKTRSGKTIGMSSAGRPQTYVAAKTNKTVPPSLVDFIKDYLSQDEQEI
jgi:hypothetical protein